MFSLDSSQLNSDSNGLEYKYSRILESGVLQYSVSYVASGHV